MSITLRREKGEPLSFDEADINFSSFYYSSSIARDGQGNRFLRLFYTGSEGLDLNQYLPGRESQIPLGVLESDLQYTTPSGSDKTVQINNNGEFQGYSDFVRTETGIGIGTNTPATKLDVVGTIALNNGGNSTYIGEDAGISDSGNVNSNTAIGYQALSQNITGSQNTALGFQAGSFSDQGTNQYSTNSIFIGYQAKPQQESQNNQIVIGSFATGNGENTVTIGNSQIQQTILRGIVSVNNGQGSAYVGQDAGGNDTNTNSNNVGIGVEALASNTSGVFNTVTGYQGLSRKTSGDRNTAYGYEAGKLTSTAQDTLTSNDSVFLGANTKPQSDNQTNQIVIGYNTEGSGSNTVTLGNDQITDTYLKGDITINKGIYASDSLGSSGDILTSTGTGITWAGSSEFERTANKGVANGYVPLNTNVKIPEQYLPDSILGQVVYQGTWNANTNTPELTNPPQSSTQGRYYVVDVAGIQFGIDFQVGDWIISNGVEWQKVDNTDDTDLVTSVNSQTGSVVLDADDIDDSTTTNKFTSQADIDRLANTSGSNTGDQDLSNYVDRSTNQTINGEKYFLDNVGIGSTSPSEQLEVNGNIQIINGSLGVNVTPNATNGRIDASNDIVAFSSDIRLKQNNKVIDKPLEKIKSLKGFTYNWNNLAQQVAGFDTEQKMVGVSAQDVQKTLPEAVKLAPFDNDGNDKSISGEDYLTVQYDKIVPLLIEAIKEQQTQIEELKKLIK